MRIVLLVLAVTAVAFLALPSTPVASLAPAAAFASEVPTIEPIPPTDYCQRYCHGAAGQQYCSDSWSAKKGCHHINSSGNCIYTLCPKFPPPTEE